MVPAGISKKFLRNILAEMLKTAIISGKGGTGKTLVSTNLANIISKKGIKTLLCDADAEEPDSGIFFGLKKICGENVLKKIPEVDLKKCSLCSLCVDSCNFSAIHISKSKSIILDSLCHGCGLCKMICPERAITERDKEIGVVNTYHVNQNLSFMEGRLNIGEPSAVPVIRQLKHSITDEYEYVLVDSPPGCSCSVVETLRECDYALVITEPTPFGMHDLKMALTVLKDMEIPYSVVLNRWDKESQPYEEEIIKAGGKIIMKIPYDRRIAGSYSHGKLISEEYEEYGNMFNTLFIKLKCEVEGI